MKLPHTWFAEEVRGLRTISRFWLAATLAATIVIASGCGDPMAPTPQLQISCPASTSVESLTGSPVTVDFGAPTATGGSQPVSVSCTPPSGSSFPVGANNVRCTARDAKQQTASCNLNVTVTRVGTLSATRFLAFGDSITFGTPPLPCNNLSSGVMTRDTLRRDLEFLFQATHPRDGPPTSYPSVLRGLLATRYIGQSPTVANEGLGGEAVTDMGGTNDATLNRLSAAISTHAPEVLLLQEGINDLNALNPLHPEVAIPQVVKALSDMIGVARSRGGIRVFLGTFLPLTPGACRQRVDVAAIAVANTQLKAMAAAAGAGVVVVDLYQGFGGVPGPYIGFDGLHPTPLGYEKMAQTFLDTIKTTLEVPR